MPTKMDLFADVGVKGVKVKAGLRVETSDVTQPSPTKAIPVKDENSLSQPSAKPTSLKD